MVLPNGQTQVARRVALPPAVIPWVAASPRVGTRALPVCEKVRLSACLRTAALALDTVACIVAPFLGGLLANGPGAFATSAAVCASTLVDAGVALGAKDHPELAASRDRLSNMASMFGCITMIDVSDCVVLSLKQEHSPRSAFHAGDVYFRTLDNRRLRPVTQQRREPWGDEMRDHRPYRGVMPTLP